MFGIPNSRLRAYRICFNAKLKKWTCQLTLQQLADILLASKNAQLPLDYTAFMVSTGFEKLPVFQSDLTELLAVTQNHKCLSFSLTPIYGAGSDSSLRQSEVPNSPFGDVQAGGSCQGAV